MDLFPELLQNNFLLKWMNLMKIWQKKDKKGLKLEIYYEFSRGN